MSLILKAIPFKQRNVKMYSAIVPISDLEYFSVDIWDDNNVMKKRGYQRQPDEKRVKKIAKYFERKDSIMPVAGLLNVREKDKIKYLDGKITIPDGTKIWVVDMQHRLKGLIHARDEHDFNRSEFNYPVVITEGLKQIEEAAQFYIINTKAKKMDVALTRRLLIENNKIRDIADVKPWEIPAVKITIDINKTIKNNPWYGAIRQPNEERLKSHIATEKSFVVSLRQLLIGKKSIRARYFAKRLSNFWNAIENTIPDAFDEPRKYLIQKTAGMFAFNFFIAPIFLNLYKDQEFEKRLKGLRNLGSDFWKRSNKQGARRFGSGMGGYSNLAEFIKSKL